MSKIGSVVVIYTPCGESQSGRYRIYCRWFTVDDLYHLDRDRSEVCFFYRTELTADVVEII